MTANTRPTLKSTNLRIDSIEGKLDAILARLEGAAPAKTVRKPKASAKPKAAAKPVTQPKADAPAKVRALCKVTRADFVAAAAAEGWVFQGMSTKAIAEACLQAGYCPEGYRIGEGYRTLLAG